MRVDQVITQSIQRCSDRVAVVEEHRRWTYRELGHTSSELQAVLGNAGFSVGDRAVLWLENSAEYIACYLAVLSLGGVVVALHSKSLATDLLFAIQHVGAAALFTTAPAWELCGSTLQNSGIRCAVVSGKCIHLNGTPSTEETPKGLAQIVFTSGTTGRPKGVMLTHKNLVSNMRSILDCLQINHSDSIVAVLPFVFVYGSSIMLTHLFAGAKLVIENTLVFPKLAIDRMHQEKVTGFSGVASTYSLLLRHSSFNSSYVPSMRYLTSAGGPMPAELLRGIQLRFPQADFLVMYGQTEATARLSILPAKDLERKRGSAGRAFPGVTIKALRGDGTEAAPGETGEITVVGDNVMLGYWKNPADTARVLANGMLHTGDVGHIDNEGYVYITGRDNEMIKSGEHRISPTEIEDVLYRHPGVHEAGVVGVEDPILGEVIVGLVVPKSGMSPSTGELLGYCAAHLASYKRPKSIYIVDELPKSLSGKILRQALRELAKANSPRSKVQGPRSKKI